MDDYIKRADAQDMVHLYAVTVDKTDTLSSVLRNIIRDIPAADVWPVVLCKDCVHFTSYSVLNADGTGMCGLCGKRPIGFMVDENDFCSSGERRGAKKGGVIDDP